MKLIFIYLDDQSLCWHYGWSRFTDKVKSDFLKFYLIKESSQCTKGFTILEIEIVQ